MPGWTVPGYTGVRALGSGGFGEVVLARHDATGTLVAIKYLRGDLLADPGFAAMFRAEAAVLAAVDDLNVVRLYEYVEAPGGAAIVMELVDGVSLREILARQGATTAEAALVVLQGSLLGLAAAHRRGVVHRDYKPENVLIDAGGGSKLTDFGLAARAGDRPVPAGTVAYVAPEQIAGAPASPAGDVYAATATFYECLTGAPPFAGDTARVLAAHQHAPVPLDPVPVPLRPLVAAGMAKDPAWRPADARTLVTALQAAAAPAYGPDWARRGRSHLGEAALLLAALWPSATPPAVQAATVQRVSLLRHLTPVKAAIAAGTIVAIAAGAAALGVALSHGSSAAPPTATVCQPDGTGCTKAGSYRDPNALINSNYTGFKVTWTSTYVQPYSSGVPLYWTVGITYQNVASSALTLTCPGNWANASYVVESMSGGKGDDGTVSAGSTTCSQDPGWTDTVQPGGTVVVHGTFHNVPWPGCTVAIRWGGAGRSAPIYPFKSGT